MLMSQPLVQLPRVLETIARNTQVLPAFGKAVEELLHPDLEEAQDAFLSRDDSLIEHLIEKPNTRLYVPTPPLPRTEKHLLRYFLDGSIRTWFLGMFGEDYPASPILLAQIGVAVIEREDDGRIHLFNSQLHHRLLLLMAREHLSSSSWKKLKHVTSTAGIDLVDILGQETYSQTSDLRARAFAVGIAKMAELEAQTAMKVSATNKPGLLVLDGSMRVKGLAHAEQTIAIAKSFSKVTEFSFGNTRGWDKKSVLHLLSDLPPHHRTAVFGGRSRTIAFWYVRLHDASRLGYPVMGVVKVEIPNPSGEAVDSTLINEISRAVVAERSVNPYGLDPRWHVHIYPIYCAEQAIKNRFYSTEELEVIRWSTHLR